MKSLRADETNLRTDDNASDNTEMQWGQPPTLEAIYTDLENFASLANALAKAAGNKFRIYAKREGREGGEVSLIVYASILVTSFLHI